MKNLTFEELKGFYRYIKGQDLSEVFSEVQDEQLYDDLKIEKVKELIPDWLLKRIQIKPYFDYKDGEHRKLTFLFIHFAGISYDKEKSKKILKKFYSILRETADKYDGWINRIDVYKDSERTIVIFGFPNAYEDGEKRAMIFINELINNIEIKNIRIKAGVNSGFVFIAPLGSELRREYTVIGDAVNLCARIAASADLGDIIVTEKIYDKTYDLFEYDFIGEKEFKGKKHKIPIYKLKNKKEIKYKDIKKWVGGSEKIVGRKKELKKMKEIVNFVLGGKGQILSIVGEPGIGKTRLTEDFIKICNEQGNIEEEKGGWIFKIENKDLKLPDTLESLILSRIDRLDYQDRNVLQIASVLGKEFDEFLLKGIYEDEKQLNKSLKKLHTLDLLRKVTKEGEIKIYFKHILTREVAYGTLSYARKEELHRKTGFYIETKMEERKDEFLPLLSYHFYMGKDYEKALIYSVKAGENAKKVYANEEAIEFFTRAIESFEMLENFDVV